MGEVIIMRGPVGSGKSTLVKKRFPDGVVVSADQFFTKCPHPSGTEIYEFDITKLAEAHQECLCRFIDALITEEEQIVVDNTHIKQWTYDAYFKLAKNYGYEVRIIEFRPKTLDDVKLCLRRNIHEVPREVVMKMCLDFDPDDRTTEIYEISS